MICVPCALASDHPKKRDRDLTFPRPGFSTDKGTISHLDAVSTSKSSFSFSSVEINAEFLRITTCPLESTFCVELDRHTSKLLEVARKGGSFQMKAAWILRDFDEASLNAALEASTRRQYALKLLMIFLGDPVDEIIKEHQVQQEYSVVEETMAVVLTPTDVKIVLEGEEVLANLNSVVQTFVMLFGLIYTLNMQYPKKCVRTFEFVQKVLMGLDGEKTEPQSSQTECLAT
ncbi:uncharacterized protein LOC129408180 [Boleophthalmus pectinirostris]|uniref:uncharacterized protein LOC129408180 n=1 Tax=Boleophthalmus pectinirostris TaxID=150288 RepID=UPI00242F1528|nr:uncharacterized protein LOC129408180 [Boleophthalmus pectinirostris]